MFVRRSGFELRSREVQAATLPSSLLLKIAA
jgi:hypothetical protein